MGTANEVLHPRTPLEALINISYFLPVYIVSAYVFVYFIIPRFLFHHRYTAFVIVTGGVLLFNFAACYYAGVLYEHIEWGMPYQQITFTTNKYHAIVNGGFVSVTILGIAGGLRFAKQWLQKQQENEAIQHQKIASELQLLKIQINPRFLFHSLNTVKQNILAGSSKAPQLILQVADLLSYILYESDRDFTALEKELAMIESYLSLEENSEEVGEPIRMIVSGDVKDKEVVPLMLLSVVETGFEYLLESKNNFFVKINTDISAEQLSFTFKATGSFAVPERAKQKFEGLEKQLGSLYGNGHRLRIEADAKRTIISLQLPLRIRVSVSGKQTTSSFVYETE